MLSCRIFNLMCTWQLPFFHIVEKVVLYVPSWILYIFRANERHNQTLFLFLVSVECFYWCYQYKVCCLNNWTVQVMLDLSLLVSCRCCPESRCCKVYEVDTRWHCCSSLLEKWWLLLMECVWCSAVVFAWGRSVSRLLHCVVCGGMLLRILCYSDSQLNHAKGIALNSDNYTAACVFYQYIVMIYLSYSFQIS